MTTYEWLLSFLTRLEAARLHYRLEHNRDEAIMVLVAVPGERWEIEVMLDGEIEVEVFRSDGRMLHGPGAVEELLTRDAAASLPRSRSMGMGQRLTEEELRRIHGRCESATGGPWEAHVEGRDHDSGSSFVRTAAGDIELSGATDEDFDFIASARQDVPRLLEDVRALRAELDGARRGWRALPCPMRQDGRPLALPR